MNEANGAAAAVPGLAAFLRWFGRGSRGYRTRLIVIFFCLLLEMAFYTSLPLCFKVLVDDVLLGGNASILYRLLLLLSTGAVTVAVVGVGRDYLAAGVFTGMLARLRSQMFDHLQLLSLDYFSRTPSGETLNRFSGDIPTIEYALTAAIPWAALPGLDMLASTLLLFLLDWRLALLAMLVFPLALLGPRLISPAATRAGYERKVEEARALALVQENLSAQPVVKAFSLQSLARGGFRRQNLVLTRCGLRQGFLNALVERSAGAGIHFLQVLVLGVGGWLAWEKEISIGSLAAFQTLFLNLSYSLSYVTQYLPRFLDAVGAMRHIHELLDEAPQIEDSPDARLLPRFSQEIIFRDVSFHYGGRQTGLENVSFALPAGASVAFVGPSGSGKSTLLNLLLRFYDPAAGSVLLDNCDLRSASRESLRAQFGIVFQESFLFNTTVRENIRLGRPGASDAEVEAAARAAEIHDVITTWPHGYDTPVGERGNQLSGGQRQRVAIARAMVRNPAVLILDEATSALDPATEAAINATIARLGRSRTVLTLLVVTHRLAATTDCDTVFVFNEGRLLEQGSHNQLLTRRGLYHSLWQKQTGFDVSHDFERVALPPEKVRELPFMQQMSAAWLAEIATQFTTETLPADRVIFCQGDPGDRFFLLVRGRVSVRKTGPDGVEHQIAILGDGDFFGEIALVDNVPRTATVRTLVATVLMSLRRERFQQLLDQAPGLRASLQTTIRQRLASAL